MKATRVIRSLAVAMAFCVAGACIDARAEESLRRTYNFNPDWRVWVGDPERAQAEDFDDQAWRPVTLPYAWNEDEAFKLDIHSLSTGVAWYRKHFQLPAEMDGRKVFLEFEGVRQGGEFFVNGALVGRHENGVMAVGFDITRLVRFGEDNLVAVRTDSDWAYREKATGQRYQWADRNFNANYGGIPKNVRLHVTGPVYQTLPLYAGLGTTGVYVFAHDFDLPGRAATINANSQVRNESAAARMVQYDVRVVDADGREVQTFSGIPALVPPGGMIELHASGRVEGLQFWSWGYGYLYDVFTTLRVDGEAVDTVRTRTGFRKVELDHGMVRLNGRIIQFHGYAQRSSNEWPAIGLSVPPWLSDFSNRLVVEGHGNIVRWMHVTPWKQDAESCDRVGLIQMMPAGDSESDVTGRRWEQRVELMRDAIIYLRNHPSIFFYEGGNEAISEDHQQELKDLRDRFDPYGGRYVGAREMLDSQVAEYGGEMLYINKSATKPLWATEYSRDEGLRKYWDQYSPPFHKNGDGPLYRDAPAPSYNHNQDSHAIEDVVRWYDYWRERPGTGTRVSSGGCNIIFSDSNTHFRGAENYRRSGEVDPMRIPKDGYWAHKVMWDAWVDIERPAAHILGHWNYAPGVTKDVVVVSSAEKVELRINGQSRGWGEQSHRFLFTFKDIAWEPGTVTAVGYDAAGQAVCSAEHTTAGEPASLRLTRLGPDRFLADGADLALIQVEVVDDQGRRCPVAMDPVSFQLNGPAQWRGGIAQGPDNYILSQVLPAECGVNRVFLRSTTRPGDIRLEATAPGLHPASLQLRSEPVDVVHGLGARLPGENLPSYLGRGPTPEGPSYTVSRRALRIIDATAGSNRDDAGLSFDDNELSRWSNDGRLDTAWIQYTLDEPATLREVTLKLHNWRRTSYNLHLFVDGKAVWQGTTPTNLGYTTIEVEPTRGQTLTVALQGISGDQDAFDIVEISGRRDQAGGDAGQGRLSIVEIELYQ